MRPVRQRICTKNSHTPYQWVRWRDVKFEHRRSIGSSTGRAQTLKGMQSKSRWQPNIVISEYQDCRPWHTSSAFALRIVLHFFNLNMVADTCGCLKTQIYAMIG